MSGATRPLHVYNGGFFNRRIKRILQLAGWKVTTGWPDANGSIAVWGSAGTSHRGRAMAARTGAGLLYVEDAALRSLFPGRTGEPPLGLMLDGSGLHYDSSRPSDLEHHLATAPFDDSARLDQARHAIARLRRSELTKYSATRTDIDPPPPGYVLVIDQTRGDAALQGATSANFREMLAFARIENPGAPILIKTHPETVQGLRDGHFDADTAQGAALYDSPIAPYRLMEGAIAVYTWSSQLGFEAILAGHKPRVFGQPAYAGWGLTQDENPVARRTRKLTRAQLVQGLLMDMPTWYDPYRDRLSDLHGVIDALEAQARAWREDRSGFVAAGMRLWKRDPLRRFYGQFGPIRFVENANAVTAAKQQAQPLMVWANQESTVVNAPALLRVEDGFLRSRGLGADLVPPMSLVLDDKGIYYDPTRPSRLTELIAKPLQPDQTQRAERIINVLRNNPITKYNLGKTEVPAFPEGKRILVPGQVADDASILLGCTGPIKTNLSLLEAARAAHPDAVIIYKPHPDVVAGLRSGAVETATQIADCVVTDGHPHSLLQAVDAVWTMTSLLGFEALLRGLPVTCLGAPFYAGWGLTTDLAPVPQRPAAPNIPLSQLVHATLVNYPRYFDPITSKACPPEIVLARLASGETGPGRPVLRSIAKLQGLLASQSWLWRR